MIKKKICLLGAFAVGKTSLVKQFVHSIFSEKYQTSVGVKVDKKELKVKDQDVTLLIWDIQGEDEIQKINSSYLRGAAGFLLVIDGTRRDTLKTAQDLVQRMRDLIGDLPFLVLLNKSDLSDQWELDPNDDEQLIKNTWSFTKTSAKTGSGVDDAFYQLAEMMLAT